jgi:glycosyltransferase involved in cell wall biosynthesis
LAKDKINLALLWPEYEGNVTSVNDLVLGLDKSRFNVIFIYLSGHGVDTNRHEEAGHKVFYLSDIELINAFRFSILFKLARILKDNEIDVLHCHVHKPTVYGVMAARLAGTPVVLSHVHGLGRSRNYRRRLMNYLLSRKCSRIISVANGVKEDVLKNNWRMPADKVVVLENSVDYERFAGVSIDKTEARRMLGVSPDAFVFGTVGRLAPTKGLSFLIEAFSRTKEKIPSAQLVLLGTGKSRAELEQQASKTSCSNSIHFLGHRDNIEQLYRAMDVFVLSSIAEGMPRAILEAMAAGVPCIATQVGGIPEILPSRDVGRLVPAKDPVALAQAMIDLAKSPAKQLEQLCEKAADRARRCYSHEVVGEKLRNLYENEFDLCTKGR